MTGEDLAKSVYDARGALGALRRLWLDHHDEILSDDTTTLTLVKELSEIGEIALWLDVVREGVSRFPENWRLRHSYALALIHSGEYKIANQEAKKMLSIQHGEALSVEVQSLVGRVYKDMWLGSGKTEHLHYAVSCYEKAYVVDRGYYPAINVAALQSMGGLHDAGRDMAEEVVSQCDKREDYWQAASYAEALFILGRQVEARQAYQEAFAMPGVGTRHVGSTIKQARLIAERLYGDLRWTEGIAGVPKVVVFSGHLLDAPGQEVSRFPVEAEDKVRLLLRAELKKDIPIVVYSAAACGADMLFLEECQELEMETHIVLPCPEAEFLDASVFFSAIDDTGRDSLRYRFYQLCERAATITVVNRHRPQSGLGYAYTNDVMRGMGHLRAERLGLQVTAMVVWDGNHTEKIGGAASFYADCKSMGMACTVIPLHGESSSGIPQVNKRPYGRDARQGDTSIGSDDLIVKAMLFADVKNYSMLGEDQMQSFQENYMGRISEIMLSGVGRPVVAKTWGDAIYMVFDTVAEAGRFALAMRDALTDVDWAEFGLPSELSIRTAVHAGPVYSLVDPITRQFTFTGSHVTYTARMESITQPGQVYASEMFAALVSNYRDIPFDCFYEGVKASAKKYGDVVCYRLDHATSFV